EREPEPGPDDRVLLRSIARATYTYFERFVNEEGSFLAPDNFQETPNPVVAFRTSPTNIGLQLLADLSAFDFGYLGVYDLLDRVERVFATMEQLERHRGHLFNWYDTQSLRPLNPRYVSTVDSGNLAGNLLALRQGLLALHERPVAGDWVRHGLLDLVELIDGRLSDDDHGREVATALRGLLGGEQTSLEGYRAMLEEVVRTAGALEHGAAADLGVVLVQQAESHLRDLMNLGPHGIPQTMQHSNGRYNGSPPVEHATGGVEHAIPLLGELEIAWPALHARISALAAACSELVNVMDFRFLYEEQRKIFAIGYNVSDNRRDNSYYDLLASENRLASFVAIAKGDLPQEHWFHIGRTLTPVTPTPTLISWSGTMFEYLMPLLVMRNYPETLLDSTYRGAVARQIAYGREQDVPWGISESGFNARDLSMNYQYRAFGVPGLGLQSGLGNDLVIAPYATVLALPVQFEAAMANIQTLIDHGMFGQCGLYEAIDFTPDRLPPGSKGAIVRSYMVHHQGMSLVAINNVLHNARMQQRFHAEPIVQATEMLLQEKIPHSPPLQLPEESSETPHAVTTEAHVTRQFTTPHTAVPYAHTLASGAMAALFTTGGGGFLRYRDLMVTRWRADATCDNWGSWIYVRDARSGLVWSPAYQPVHEMGNGYRVTFAL
ncbi:MAG TPA: glucoamylase family protein, partial [Roseiflexaceae bacterium]|nr:glucoamylase family protein [Roseiflexaceae bacterium]